MNKPDKAATGQASANKTPVEFAVQRLYIKDVSFEIPHSPETFKQEWQPKVNIELNMQNTNLQEDSYEVVLHLTITVNNQDKVAFLVEIKQAGVFTIKHAAENDLDYLLKAACPTILFPYARTMITDLVVHASFPQLILAPINFEALYWQQKEQAKKTEGGKGEQSDKA